MEGLIRLIEAIGKLDPIVVAILVIALAIIALVIVVVGGSGR
jgi:hypothetical protein